MGAEASAGARFRSAVRGETPLRIVGVINAYCARLAAAVGFRAIYVSGGGVAAGSCGVPDLGITTIEDVLTDVRRVTNISDLPVLVDIDTGWGDVAGTIRAMASAGAAAVHIEDQIERKRCGHLPGKTVVAGAAMVDRIREAAEARTDATFVVMARTDALASEGLEPTIDRCHAYVEAGADMIFPEAVTSLETYRRFAEALGVPILANITEFGRTPLFTADELAGAGVAMVLYPLSAFRAMSAAALKVYQTIHAEGSQRSLIDLMQTRADLYHYLHYDEYERAWESSQTGEEPG